MGVASIDFQAVVHQHVSQLMNGWIAQGFSQEDAQEAASQVFNLGLIAAQQVQQEEGIQLQGMDKLMPYTEELAQRVVYLFLVGINSAVMKAYEQKLPSQEKWQFMQQVAFHVFEQSKQAAVATSGQDLTPDIQIPEDQVHGWLTQIALEALLYYTTEYEKQHGPIARTDEEPSLLSMPQEAPAPEAAESAMGMVEPESVYAEPVSPQPQPVPPPVAVPDIHHKYAAVALLLSSLPTTKQKGILSAFTLDEQGIIEQYRNPDTIAQHLNLSLVAKYLRAFKEKMGQERQQGKSRYASEISRMVNMLPPQRLERLFHAERPFVRGYIGQYLTSTHPSGAPPFSLPPGVEEAMVLYLQRNFPKEASVS